MLLESHLNLTCCFSSCISLRFFVTSTLLMGFYRFVAETHTSLGHPYPPLPSHGIFAKITEHTLFFVVHKPRVPLLPGKAEATGSMMSRSKTGSLTRGFIRFRLMLFRLTYLIVFSLIDLFIFLTVILPKKA